MIFVDASALIAMTADEPLADLTSDRLGTDPARAISAMAVWEAVAGLRHSHGVPIPQARIIVRDFMASFRLRLVPIAEAEMNLAVDAYAQYGRGRHKAGLNMGDCFAYACAKSHGARLLYIGEDFDHTDLAWVD